MVRSGQAVCIVDCSMLCLNDGYIGRKIAIYYFGLLLLYNKICEMKTRFNYMIKSFSATGVLCPHCMLYTSVSCGFWQSEKSERRIEENKYATNGERVQRQTQHQYLGREKKMRHKRDRGADDDLVNWDYIRSRAHTHTRNRTSSVYVLAFHWVWCLSAVVSSLCMFAAAAAPLFAHYRFAHSLYTIFVFENSKNWRKKQHLSCIDVDCNLIIYWVCVPLLFSLFCFFFCSFRAFEQKSKKRGECIGACFNANFYCYVSFVMTYWRECIRDWRQCFCILHILAARHQVLFLFSIAILPQANEHDRFSFGSNSNDAILAMLPPPIDGRVRLAGRSAHAFMAECKYVNWNKTM